MNLIIALTLLLTACVSRSPAQITTVPNPFRVEDAPATAGPTAAVPEADNDNAEPTEDAPPTGDVPEENPALIKLPAPTGGSETLTVTSWNVEHLGRKSFDLRENPLLDNADVITFQEVNLSKSGRDALRLIKVGIEQRTQHKMCYAFSKVPSDAKEVYGFIWRNDRIAYIKADGTVKMDCDKNAIVIRLGEKNKDRIVREPAILTLVFKPIARPFALASIHLVPENKNPAAEVEPLFDTFADVKIPIIVAGDYNLGPEPSVRFGDPFAYARGLHFASVFVSNGVKTSIKSSERAYNKPFDNFWHRGFDVTGLGIVDILEIFGDLDVATIRRTISDHAPISAGFVFL